VRQQGVLQHALVAGKHGQKRQYRAQTDHFGHRAQEDQTADDDELPLTPPAELPPEASK
jgi:hypothetical protein